MRVGTEAEVLDGLTGVLGATEEQSVGTGRGTQSKLVQGEGLTTGLLDTGAGGGGETQSSDGKLGDVQEAVVIGDGADHDHGLALLRLVDVRGDARKRNRGAVDARHEEAAENGLVEVGLRAACQRSQISFRSRLKFEGKNSSFRLSAATQEIGFWMGGRESYEPGSGTASPAPASKRSRSWAPCGGCCAHGDGPGRYLRDFEHQLVSEQHQDAERVADVSPKNRRIKTMRLEWLDIPMAADMN